MRLLRQSPLLLALKLSVVLGSLVALLLLNQPSAAFSPAYVFRYRWLEYNDEDSPESVCNCTAILREETEIQKLKILAITKDFRKSLQIPDEHYINVTRDCSTFRLKRKYLTFPLSKEEEDFPVAYSMVVHHKVQMFERLLRAIYAPQNYYCVHVDMNSAPSVFSAIEAITSCFPNVFLVSKRVSVVYAGWPRVQADLNCMADLHNTSKKWKYFINLCGQDFPLKTNLEIVRMLRALGRENSIESEKMADVKKWRVTTSFDIVNGILQNTGKPKGPVPFNLPIMTGIAYIVASPGYVQSVLEDPRIQKFIEWSKDTYSPDEFLWATIQRIPGVPGSKWPHSKYDMTDVNAISRTVKWEAHVGDLYPKCEGTYVRNICVYGIGDLRWLLGQHHLFANKFDTNTDPFIVYCLEKYLREKALAELQ